MAPHAYGMLAERVGERALRSATRLPVRDRDGWDHLRLEVDWPEEVPSRLLGAGPEVEVLGPPDVRRRMRELAERAATRYADA